jgi:hypothetical protein
MSLQTLVLANAFKPYYVRSMRRDGAPPRSISYVMQPDYSRRLNVVIHKLGITRAALLFAGLPEVLDLVEKASPPPVIPAIPARSGDGVVNASFPVKPELVARVDAVARLCGCSRVVLASWAMTQTVERAERMLSQALADAKK